MTGLKDRHYGEVVAAFLECASGFAKPEADEVRDWVRQKLSKLKAPACIFWLGEGGIPATIPLTGSGKVKKYEMARLGEEIIRQRASVSKL